MHLLLALVLGLERDKGRRLCIGRKQGRIWGRRDSCQRLLLLLLSLMLPTPSGFVRSIPAVQISFEEDDVLQGGKDRKRGGIIFVGKAAAASPL